MDKNLTSNMYKYCSLMQYSTRQIKTFYLNIKVTSVINCFKKFSSTISNTHDVFIIFYINLKMQLKIHMKTNLHFKFFNKI